MGPPEAQLVDASLASDGVLALKDADTKKSFGSTTSAFGNNHIREFCQYNISSFRLEIEYCKTEWMKL